MNKINNNDILTTIYTAFDNYAYDYNIITKTVTKCYNKNLLIIEKMIDTGHYTKDDILKDIINSICETKKAVVSISPKRKKVLNLMFRNIAKDDSQIINGESFVTMYKQYLREYNDIQKARKNQKTTQKYKKISAFIPENINKFLTEQSAYKKNDKKSNKFKGGWISIFSRLFTSLKSNKKCATTKKYKKQGKKEKS